MLLYESNRLFCCYGVDIDVVAVVAVDDSFFLLLFVSFVFYFGRNFENFVVVVAVAVVVVVVAVVVTAAVAIVVIVVIGIESSVDIVVYFDIAEFGGISEVVAGIVAGVIVTVVAGIVAGVVVIAFAEIDSAADHCVVPDDALTAVVAAADYCVVLDIALPAVVAAADHCVVPDVALTDVVAAVPVAVVAAVHAAVVPGLFYLSHYY